MRVPITPVAMAAVLAIFSTGCGSSSATRRAIGSASPHRALTEREYAAAVALARREVHSQDANLTSATATVGTGTVADSNTGHDCASGRLLHIKLIGAFPHIATSGHPVDSTAKPEDFTVQAMLLTADAQTGRACLISVQTGHVAPDPGAEVLHLN